MQQRLLDSRSRSTLTEAKQDAKGSHDLSAVVRRSSAHPEAAIPLNVAVVIRSLDPATILPELQLLTGFRLVEVDGDVVSRVRYLLLRYVGQKGELLVRSTETLTSYLAVNIAVITTAVYPFFEHLLWRQIRLELRHVAEAGRLRLGC